jgi:hypothetical protein
MDPRVKPEDDEVLERSSASTRNVLDTGFASAQERQPAAALAVDQRFQGFLDENVLFLDAGAGFRTCQEVAINCNA